MLNKKSEGAGCEQAYFWKFNKADNNESSQINLCAFLLETCEGDCCWQGPSRYVIESKGPADGIRSWPEEHDTVDACAKRCEDLSDCRAFHYYGPGEAAYKDCYLQKGGVIGPQLSDGIKRFAGVCKKEGRFPYVFKILLWSIK